MRAIRIAGLRVLHGYPRQDRTAELQLKFFGRATAEVTIRGNDNSHPLTISVNRNELIRMVLGELMADEIAAAHEDENVAMRVWHKLWKGLGG